MSQWSVRTMEESRMIEVTYTIKEVKYVSTWDSGIGKQYILDMLRYRGASNISFRYM